MESSNIQPELRFPEYTDNWIETILGNPDITTFLKGKGISKNDIDDSGQTKCIRYGELYTQYNEVIEDVISRTNIPIEDLVFSEVNDVIIPSSGETILDIATASCVMEEGIALGGDLNVIRSSIDGVFLSYYLNSVKKRAIARLSQGISVIHLYSTHLKTLKINIPSNEEQQKIANFLIAINKRINLLEEKKKQLEEYKKGVMQKIFNQEIRFKDDNDNDFPDWEEKKVDDVFEGLRGKGLSKDVIVENGESDCILYGELFTKYSEVIHKIISKTNSEEGVKSINGDLLIPTSTTTTGIDLANVTAILKNDVQLGGDITILRNKIEIAPLFYAYYLSNYKKYEISRFTQGITIVHLYFNHIKKMPIHYPDPLEQNRIGEFLYKIDDKIFNLKELMIKTSSFKDALLQRLFV